MTDTTEFSAASSKTDNGLVTQTSRILANFQRFTSQPSFQRSLPAIVAVAVMFFGLLFYLYMQQPSRTTLYASLPDSEKSRVVDSLKNMGIDVSLDPATGEVLEEGEKGELVFTSLTKEAFPIIRYRTKDLTRLFPGTARSMRRMEKVTGRSDDLMIIRGVNVFPSQIEENILGVRELSPHFQIELTRRDRLDEMLVRVELSNLGDWSKRNEYEKFLSKKIKDSLGITTTVSIEQKGLVARSEGKATRVVDNRKLY